MIAQVVGDEAAGADSESAIADQGTPAATGVTDAAPQLVDVSLTNFAIDMPTELTAGPVRFNIVNNGVAPHSFVLEGEGIRKTLANTLQPGNSARLNADLAPGDYTIFCPVGEGEHRAQGMELELRVS
jgi:hypothetical protein